MASVVVVGGGVSGLAAAWELATSRPGLDVVLLEASARVGGKLALGSVAGQQVDVGAESMLARRPEAIELAREVGLADDLEPPRPVGASIWSRGELTPLPPGTLMGVPSSGTGLAGLLTDEEVARVEDEPMGTWPPLERDVDVASLVSARVGSAVVDRLVEPLLGGVYAGRAADLSVQATVPVLWAAAHEGRSVVAAARSASQASTGGPVFAGLRGGVGRLPRATREALLGRGVDIRTGVTVRELSRTPSGWRLVTGATSAPETLTCDGVLLAVPAAPAARLLRGVAPVAADGMAGIETASMAIVTLALDRGTVQGLSGSGALVPVVDGRYVKAVTFSSSKWGWLDEAGEHVVVRASVGRHGQVGDLQLPDDEIVRRVRRDLAELPGVRLGEPVDALVTRWGGGLPQYAVGHPDRIAGVRVAIEAVPGLELAGASFDGVGIAACVGSGRQAAQRMVTHLDRAGAGYGTLGA
ncbi:protoporphyrinogen oxidase [Angustibacter sp. McL0619]|uniref:protoporphyrinogen oxidase n=1 Tax=Angustibacter sp. McL0619 TaxID=3415676 RepID=UPI003CED0DCE